jgi:hypothetical protein
MYWCDLFSYNTNIMALASPTYTPTLHNTGGDLPHEWFCPITYEIMRDPVIAPDTRTYERSNIEEWIRTHGNSPFTREPMRVDQLIPNRALRDLIEKATDTSTEGTEGTDDPSEEHTAPPVKNTIYCLIDRSGSMGLTIDTPGYESDGFSRLDLVKHSVRTIIHSLTPEYALGIATFSVSARMDMVPKRMNGAAKAHAVRVLERIEEYSSTNIWDGIRLIMREHTEGDTPTILLFTDGVSNMDPPRGILETLSREIERTGVVPTIHTLGFGYDIDSVLLHDIANTTGGVFGFIPDCTMIGSVFVNILTHVIASSEGDTRPTEPKWPELVDYLDVFAKKVYDFDGDREKDRIGILIDALMLRYDNTQELRNVCTDIQDVSDDKGQIEKAVSNLDWFVKWGKHYLLSLHLAHKNCVCINFKDASLQNYKTLKFNTTQDIVENAFIDLPPPEPSVRSVREAIASGTQMRTPMSVYYNSASGCFTKDTLVRVCDQRSYKIADDEEQRFKSIDDLSPGDWVVSNNNHSTQIKFITVFRRHTSSVSRLSQSLTISAYHPVRRYNGVNGVIKPKWEFPCEIAGSSEETHDLYNLVLKPNHSGKTMGIIYTPTHECVVFGHGIHTDEVVSHDYFGTHAIVDDIAEENEKQNGNGVINVHRLHEVRDSKTGRVVKYLFNE